MAVHGQLFLGLTVTSRLPPAVHPKFKRQPCLLLHAVVSLSTSMMRSVKQPKMLVRFLDCVILCVQCGVPYWQCRGHCPLDLPFPLVSSYKLFSSSLLMSFTDIDISGSLPLSTANFVAAPDLATYPAVSVRRQDLRLPSGARTTINHSCHPQALVLSRELWRFFLSQLSILITVTITIIPPRTPGDG